MTQEKTAELMSLLIDYTAHRIGFADYRIETKVKQDPDDSGEHCYTVVYLLIDPSLGLDSYSDLSEAIFDAIDGAGLTQQSDVIHQIYKRV